MNNLGNNPSNILFYSNKCDTCRSLIQILQNEGMLSSFYLFNVDERIRELPPQIRHVPTMIVKNIEKPLVAEDTFKFVTQMKFFKQQQVANNNRIIQQNFMKMMAANQKKQPIGFVGEEMGGISDRFAYKDVDKALPHTYVDAMQQASTAIFTAPKEEGKLRKDEQSKLIQNLENRRKEQELSYKDSMKEEQLKSVLFDEQQKEYDEYIKRNPQNRNNYR